MSNSDCRITKKAFVILERSEGSSTPCNSLRIVAMYVTEDPSLRSGLTKEIEKLTVATFGFFRRSGLSG